MPRRRSGLPSAAAAMSRSVYPVQTGLPTVRQRALVLLVLVNAGGSALHPIWDLHKALNGKVPMPTVWYVVASLLHYGLLCPDGTNDQRAGYVLTSHGVVHAVKEIDAEMTRTLGENETMLQGDANRLGLTIPHRVIVRIENNYACCVSSGGEHEVPAPPVNASEEDLDGWWTEHVEPLTGDGHECGTHEDSWYAATIVAAPGRPELVGLDWESMDT